MLKIKLVCVGRLRESYFAQACEEYRKRLSRFCKCEIFEVLETTLSKEPSEGERIRILEKEGEAILRAASGKLILFDLHGQKCPSEEFSKKVKQFSDACGELTFAIGGSYGLSDELRRRADWAVSFSDMTFPHMLFRVMALEQIYRAFMITAGSEYHK